MKKDQARDVVADHSALRFFRFIYISSTSPIISVVPYMLLVFPFLRWSTVRERTIPPLALFIRPTVSSLSPLQVFLATPFFLAPQQIPTKNLVVPLNERGVFLRDLYSPVFADPPLGRTRAPMSPPLSFCSELEATVAVFSAISGGV